MSSSFNDVTFWKVYLESFKHILSCIVMSSSFNVMFIYHPYCDVNDVTFWKVYLESSNIFFHILSCILESLFRIYKHILSCDVIILQWCHILESLFRNVHSYSFMYYSDVIILQWCHILESLFRMFIHILSSITVMSSSFNDVTYWNVRLVRVDTSSVLLQYTHTWQSLLRWIFATYLFVFQNNASFKEYGWF